MMMRTVLLSLSALGLSAAILTGCGFTPVHQNVSETSGLQAVNVQLEKGKNVADNQAGFLITQRLRDRIGTANPDAPYTLVITPRYGRQDFGLSDQDVSSRFDITVRATYDLKDSRTGETLDRGRVTSVSTFGAPDGPYGIITADNVGVEQASSETADKLIRELAVYFSKNRS